MQDQPQPDTAEYTAEDTAAEPARKKRRGPLRVAVSVVNALIFAVIAFAGLVVFAVMFGRSVELPDWAVRQLENQATAQLTGESVRIRSVEFGLLDDAYRPTFDLRGVVLRDSQNRALVSLPHLRSKLDTSELLQGRMAVETLSLSNATLNLVRTVSGELTLGFDLGLNAGDEIRSVSEILAKIDSIFADPLLRELEEIETDGLRLRYTDQRSGETVSLSNGDITLVNAETALELRVGFDLALPDADPANVSLTITKTKGAAGAELMARFTDLDSRDLGRQVGALNFLSILDAPVSGALSTEIAEDGSVGRFAGTLSMSSGAVRPARQAKPLPFEEAQIYVRYDAATSRLHFDEISVDAPELRFNGSGYADLLDVEAGVPQTLLGQLRFTEIRLDPEGVFASPVSFQEGLLDLRYRPRDLVMDIGQLVLRDAGTELLARGSVRVVAEGWDASLDASIDTISQDRLMALWPRSSAAGTRRWLVNNLIAGEIDNATAAVRVTPTMPVETAFSFDFSRAQVRYVKTLPTIRNANGYATMNRNRFVLALHRGIVVVPRAGIMRLADSVLEIDDVRLKPATAEFAVNIDGSVRTALEFLDYKPFEFLSKSDLKPDLATGQAEIALDLVVPLKRRVQPGDVGYAVSARLSDVRSETLVKDRVLSADRLELRAGDGRLTIGGQGSLDGVPLDATWSRALGPGTGAQSEVSGTVALSQNTLDAFETGLPPGTLSGSGTGLFNVALEKGTAPQLRLQSDLKDLSVAVPALGWSKAPAAEADLELAMRLGPSPQIESLRLEAPGLSAEGRIVLGDDGTLDRAIFDTLRVDGKLDAQVELLGQGAGNPAKIIMSGGSVDIRGFDTQGPRRNRPPMELALDQVIVTDEIALTGFRGAFRAAAGLDGTFTASVNGGAPVEGTIVPTDKGPAIRILSDNGGRVLAASGIFRNANDGDMVLILQPTDTPGHLGGRLEIADTRVKNAPALADLLSAVSVIGLLEQLSGAGITFSTVEANFTLAPNGVTVRNASAVGPSMGITMEGVYDPRARNLDMRGVISPIYAVNGLFGALFAPRRGEGLFGFNYTLKGPAEGPRVGVNPLSVFTPGIFREIFRQAPPKLKN
ncbi:MAG: hypothetical protein JXR14_06605 [Paracoccaceae bacterium]